jgi:hypothetical protein
MILHLAAPEAAPGYAIFDPAIATALHGQERSEEAIAGVLSENGAGNLILYANAAGVRNIQVCVDEEPEERLRKAGIHFVRDGICRFPAGRICLASVDGIRRIRADAGVVIPAGEYQVEGFDVDWAQQPERALRSALGMPGYAIWLINQSLISIGCFSIFLLAVAPLIGMFRGGVIWRAALAVGLVAVLTIGLTAGCRRLSAFRRMREEVRRIDQMYPSAVLVMRRLPDDADLSQLGGLAFGPDHTKRNRAKGFEVILDAPATKS